MKKLKFTDSKEFFDKCGDMYLEPMLFGIGHQFTMEEMYQHFKQRLVSELIVQSDELLNPARLTDNEEVEED